MSSEEGHSLYKQIQTFMSEVGSPFSDYRKNVEQFIKIAESEPALPGLSELKQRIATLTRKPPGDYSGLAQSLIQAHRNSNYEMKFGSSSSYSANANEQASSAQLTEKLKIIERYLEKMGAISQLQTSDADKDIGTVQDAAGKTAEKAAKEKAAREQKEAADKRVESKKKPK